MSIQSAVPVPGLQWSLLLTDPRQAETLRFFNLLLTSRLPVLLRRSHRKHS